MEVNKKIYEKLLNNIPAQILLVDKEQNVNWHSVSCKLPTKESVKCYEIIHNKTLKCEQCLADFSFETNEEIKSEIMISDNNIQNISVKPIDIDNEQFALITIFESERLNQKTRLDKIFNNLSNKLEEYGSDDFIKIYNNIYDILFEEFELFNFYIVARDQEGIFLEYAGINETLIIYSYDDSIENYINNIAAQALSEQKMILSHKGEITDTRIMDIEDTWIVIPISKEKAIVASAPRLILNEYSMLKVFLLKAADLVKTIFSRNNTMTKISYQASHDYLTGLFNRSYFNNILSKIFNNNRRNSIIGIRYAVALIDLDKFKSVNDTYGHLAGDKLLIEISKRMIKCLRDGDIAARFGGDEFAICIRYTNDKELIPAFNRIRNEIIKPIRIDELMLSVGASIGIVADATNIRSVEEVIMAADKSMYYAKNHKKETKGLKVFQKDY